ncbi:MAG TPA: hypothetical protein VGK73_28305 [Polyangiaceae bacterium]
MLELHPDPTLRRDAFPKTEWSVVLKAGREDGSAALAALCKAYWYPVYSFLRAKGADPERAADLTQGFFEYLIEKGEVRKADPARGRFRSFLRSAAKHFYLNAIDYERRQKRGGDQVRLSIDMPGAEARLGAELSHSLSPDRLFDLCWAEVVTQRARREFEAGCDDPDDLALLRRLCGKLSGQDDPLDSEPRAASSPMSGAERIRRHRHKERVLAKYRRYLRGEIMRTLDDSSLIDDEIRYLLDVRR